MARADAPNRSLVAEYRAGLSAAARSERTRFQLEFAKARGAAGCKVMLAELSSAGETPEGLVAGSIAAGAAVRNGEMSALLVHAREMPDSAMRNWMSLKWATAHLIAGHSIEEALRVCKEAFDPAVFLDACTSARVDAVRYLGDPWVQKRLSPPKPCLATLRAAVRHIQWLARESLSHASLQALEGLLPLVEVPTAASEPVERLYEGVLGPNPGTGTPRAWRSRIREALEGERPLTLPRDRERYGLRFGGRRIAFVLDMSESMRSTATAAQQDDLAKLLGASTEGSGPTPSVGETGKRAAGGIRFEVARRTLYGAISQLDVNQEYVVVGFARSAAMLTPGDGFDRASRGRFEAVRAQLDPGRFGTDGTLGISTDLYSAFDLALRARASAVRSNASGQALHEVMCDEVVLITDGEPNRDDLGQYGGREIAHWRGAPFYGDHALSGQLFECVERRLWAAGSLLHVIAFGEARPDFASRLAHVGGGGCVVLGQEPTLDPAPERAAHAQGLEWLRAE